MRKCEREEKKTITSACMLRYVYTVFFVSFLFIFILLVLIGAANGRANVCYFLFHLHCHVQRAHHPRSISLIPDKIIKEKHISIISFSRALFGTFLFFLSISSRLCSLIRHSIEHNTRATHSFSIFILFTFDILRNIVAIIYVFSLNTATA